MSVGEHEHDRTFISFTLPELLALTETDLDQLDALSGSAGGIRLWWFLKRLEWEQDRENSVGEVRE